MQLSKYYFDVTEVAEDGYWGFPKEGTVEKGRKAMDLMVQCGLDYINDVENVTMKLKSKSIERENKI